MNVHQVRARQLKLLLFGDLSEASIKDEKGQLRPCLFMQLPADVMTTVSNSLQECQCVLDRYQISHKYGFSTSDIRDAFGDDIQKQHASESYSAILKWALRDKKKVVKMIAEYAECVEYVYQQILLYFLIKDHDTAQLRTLEENKEAQELEITKRLRMKRIIESDRTTADNTVVKLELDMMEFASARTRGSCALHEGNFDDQQVLLEFVDYTEDESAPVGVPNLVVTQVNRLAALLQSPKPKQFLGLRSRGFIHQPTKQRFAFVYDYPDIIQDPMIVNLSELLFQHTVFRPTLTRRFVLAHQLALAILNLHMVGWVHKNLRSSNIIFFRSGENWKLSNREQFVQPWLCGFEYSRPESGESWMLEDHQSLLQNIYRHKDRWGKPTVKFEKKHDIYALGVVLLEIGLWEPAVSFQSRGFEDWAEDANKVSERILQHASSRLGFFCRGSISKGSPWLFEG